MSSDQLHQTKNIRVGEEGEISNISSSLSPQINLVQGIHNQQEEDSLKSKHFSQEETFPEIDCIFCEKFDEFGSFCPLLNKALYQKYVSSQNYFYQKDINDIISNTSRPVVIRFKDMETYDEEEEFLKREYLASQLPKKMEDLTEYYKYHKDIPRLFMQSVGHIMNRFHDKRRRIEYHRIKKMLNLETSSKESVETEEYSNSDGGDEDDENEVRQVDANGKKLPRAIPKECQGMLQNLSVTLDFHDRPLPKKLHPLTKTVSNTHLNPFYMNSDFNKKFKQTKEQASFDTESLLKKPSHNRFFKNQEESLHGHQQFKEALQNMLVSFGKNNFLGDKAELSFSHFNSFLYTQTTEPNEFSLASNQSIIPSNFQNHNQPLKYTQSLNFTKKAKEQEGFYTNTEMKNIISSAKIPDTKRIVPNIRSDIPQHFSNLNTFEQMIALQKQQSTLKSIQIQKNENQTISGQQTNALNYPCSFNPFESITQKCVEAAKSQRQKQQSPLHFTTHQHQISQIQTARASSQASTSQKILKKRGSGSTIPLTTNSTLQHQSSQQSFKRLNSNTAVRQQSQPKKSKTDREEKQLTSRKSDPLKLIMPTTQLQIAQAQPSNSTILKQNLQQKQTHLDSQKIQKRTNSVGSFLSSNTITLLQNLKNQQQFNLNESQQLLAPLIESQNTKQSLDQIMIAQNQIESSSQNHKISLNQNNIDYQKFAHRTQDLLNQQNRISSTALEDQLAHRNQIFSQLSPTSLVNLQQLSIPHSKRVTNTFQQDFFIQNDQKLDDPLLRRFVEYQQIPSASNLIEPQNIPSSQLMSQLVSSRLQIPSSLQIQVSRAPQQKQQPQQLLLQELQRQIQNTSPLQRRQSNPLEQMPIIQNQNVKPQRKNSQPSLNGISLSQVQSPSSQNQKNTKIHQHNKQNSGKRNSIPNNQNTDIFKIQSSQQVQNQTSSIGTAPFYKTSSYQSSNSSQKGRSCSTSKGTASNSNINSPLLINSDQLLSESAQQLQKNNFGTDQSSFSDGSAFSMNNFHSFRNNSDNSNYTPNQRALSQENINKMKVNQIFVENHLIAAQNKLLVQIKEQTQNASDYYKHQRNKSYENQQAVSKNERAKVSGHQQELTKIPLESNKQLSEWKNCIQKQKTGTRSNSNSPINIKKNILSSSNGSGSSFPSSSEISSNQIINIQPSKQIRVDTFAARVSNMANIFEAASQQKTGNNISNKYLLASNTSTGSGGSNTTSSRNAGGTSSNNTLSNFATQSTVINFTNHQSPMSSQLPSARLHLNLKNTANSSQLSSFSRNNSPNKVKMENNGSFPSQILSDNSPLLPISVTTRTSSNLRGVQKPTSLIRFRQNFV